MNAKLIGIVLVFCMLSAGSALAEEIYVDARNGSDKNPGLVDKPVKTLTKAASLVNKDGESGPTTVRIAPGVYHLAKQVLFQNKRPYTKEERLTIEALILPDDPKWEPTRMPVIISTEDPPKIGLSQKLKARGTATYGLQIEMSHVTVRGLKFLGSPATHNRCYPIRRNGKNLDDLEVTQCLFVGDRDALPLHCAIIANGRGLVVDHCVFFKCKNGPLFWRAKGGKSNGNALRYCIVDRCYVSGFWTCEAGEDLEFHHNIVTRCGTFHVREFGNRRKYRLSDCIITNNGRWTGYSSAGKPVTPAGPEATYEEHDVIKEGKVILEKDESELDSLNKTRNYLHVAPGTLGSDLGAGLFLGDPK